MTSAHRALLFSSKAVEEQPDHTHRMSERCLEHPEWLHRVLTHFRHLQGLEPVPRPGTGLRLLVLLKLAVLVTTQSIQKELAKTMKKHEPGDGAKDLALITAFGGDAPATVVQSGTACLQVAVPATVPGDRRPRRQLRRRPSPATPPSRGHRQAPFRPGAPGRASRSSQ